METTELLEDDRYLLVIENRLFNTVDTHLFQTREKAIEKATKREVGCGSKDQAMIIDLVTEKIYPINSELLGELLKREW